MSFGEISARLSKAGSKPARQNHCDSRCGEPLEAVRYQVRGLPVKRDLVANGGFGPHRSGCFRVRGWMTNRRDAKNAEVLNCESSLRSSRLCGFLGGLAVDREDKKNVRAVRLFGR